MSHLKPNGYPSEPEDSEEEYCRHCDSEPCRCKELEDEMDERRMEGNREWRSI